MKTSLSKRETDILEAIADGLIVKEIGRKLKLTEETVKSYEKRIRKKLDIRGMDPHTRVKLARIFWEGKHIANGPERLSYIQQEIRALKAEAKIASVRALHIYADGDCKMCEEPWPCETVRILEAT